MLSERERCHLTYDARLPLVTGLSRDFCAIHPSQCFAKIFMQMVEFHRVEKYRPDQGFSVAVAGLINMKSPGAFKPPRLYKVRGSCLPPTSKIVL